jgi:NADPH:quinone reductase-like Zn-dependent oxidoreductase
MVKSIGADHVIDYTREDFTERVDEYDIMSSAGLFEGQLAELSE